jgi:signal transduction histidine kinase/GAF domain-containing protein
MKRSTPLERMEALAVSDPRLLTSQLLTSGPTLAAPPVRPVRPIVGKARHRTTRASDEPARLRALLDIAAAIAGARDPAEIAQRACEAICRLLPEVERANVRLVDPLRGGAALVAAYGYPADYSDHFAVLPLDQGAAVGKAILTGAIQYEAEAALERGSTSLSGTDAGTANLQADRTLRQLEPHALVVAPLPLVGGTAGASAVRALGALTLSVPREVTAAADYRTFALMLGHLLAQAIANAQTHAQAQAQTRAAEQLTAVLASIEDAVWVADSAGRIILTNAAAARMAGAERTEESYHSLDRWSPLDAACNFEGQPIAREALPIARALRGEHFTYLLLRTRNPLTGAEAYLRVAGGPLRDGAGAVVGAVITGNDITRRLMFERQRDAMVAATGHDIRNPLAALKGSIQLLMRHATSPGSEYERASLARMLRQVNRAAYMVSDLMDIGLLAEKRLALNRAPMDLVSLARDVVDEERANTDRRAVAFHAAVERLVGDWDQARLERVLVNLIDNAIKFSPAGTTIAVGVWSEPAAPGNSVAAEYARVSVADQGQGIAPEHLGRLFEWYFRAPEAADQTLGSGIGLAISRELLAAHGGRIWAESAGPGQGSTFHLALPLPPSESPSDRRSRSRRAPRPANHPH